MVCFNSLPNDKILWWSKFKAFVDDKINVTLTLKFDFCRVENIVRKKEKMLVTFRSGQSWRNRQRTILRLVGEYGPRFSLTNYQTTKFRLFQTERVCRRHFQFWRKWQRAIQTGRKHYWKRRNCSLRAISPFPTVFAKGLFPRSIKRCHCVGMG